MQAPLNTSQAPERVAQRLRAMFGMYEVGVDMLRCRLRREMPGAPPEAINAEVMAYLRRDRGFDSPLFRKRTCSRFSAKS
jgi:hypothetical protein